MTGEFSNESSKQCLHVAVDVDKPFVTNNSIRSGVLLVSVGQLVGSPVEITLRLRFSMAYFNFRSFGETSFEPCVAVFVIIYSKASRIVKNNS